MPISTEGLGMPTKRPKTGYPVWGGGGGRELLTCPYPLKVQARLPRDQRLAMQSRVSGREGKKGATEILQQLRSMSELCLLNITEGFIGKC